LIDGERVLAEHEGRRAVQHGDGLVRLDVFGADGWRPLAWMAHNDAIWRHWVGQGRA
jgi:hypothetical protein